MDNRTFGYARVSSREQHEDRQIEALTNYGVSRDNIIVDKCSGKDTEREGYQYLKKQICTFFKFPNNRGFFALGTVSV